MKLIFAKNGCLLILAIFFSFYSFGQQKSVNKQKHQNKLSTSGPLFHEIAHLDTLQFAAFNARNIDQLKIYFDSSLELYQDNVGVRNYNETVQAFTNLFKLKYVLTRKLIPGSMEVYPIKGFGAIQTGRHSFSHIENGKRQSATYKFMQIWQKKDGTWRVTREVTYDH